MQNPQPLYSTISMMIHTAVSHGQDPVAFKMNSKTFGAVMQDIKSMSSWARSNTIWDKIADWMRPKTRPENLRLCGVQVHLLELLPDGAIYLETARRQVPQGSGADDDRQGQGSPFVRVDDDHSQEPAEYPTASTATGSVDTPPTLNDLSSSHGKVSPTDVLIKAMDKVDDLSGVVVVRVHRSGDIDMCLSCNQFEAQGILQKAQYCLAMNGGR